MRGHGAYLLGSRHESFESESFLEEAGGIVYFSYRSGFPKVEGTLRTSDTGWGCAHRSAQMLLCRALSKILREREGQGQEVMTRERLMTWSMLGPLVALFADHPLAPFSLHALAGAAHRASGPRLRPGEWLGPSSASVAIRATVNARQPAGLRCVLVQDGILYAQRLPRAGPVLVLAPLRLGLGRLNHEYLSLVHASLACPLCVGIIGGQGDSSLYVFASQEDQQELCVLDPHTTQPSYHALFASLLDKAPPGADICNHLLQDAPNPSSFVSFDVSSFQARPCSIPAGRLDPSLSVGYVCCSPEEQLLLRAHLLDLAERLPYAITWDDAGEPPDDSSLLSGAAPAAPPPSLQNKPTHPPSPPSSNAANNDDDWTMI